MKPRTLFRAPCGSVINTRSQVREALWVLAVSMMLVALLAWGLWRDTEGDTAAAFAAGHRTGYAVGEQTTVNVLQDAVAAAYRQGRVDAAADLGQPLAAAGCGDKLASMAELGAGGRR